MCLSLCDRTSGAQRAVIMRSSLKVGLTKSRSGASVLVKSWKTALINIAQTDTPECRRWIHCPPTTNG